MDKLVEKYLKRIVIESMLNDIDELAYVAKDKQSQIDKETGEKRPKKFRPKYDDGSPFPEEDRKKNIPDYVIANPNLEKDGEFIIVPLLCGELETFEEQNKEWLKSIGVKHGDLKVQTVRCYRSRRSEYPHVALEKLFPSKQVYDKSNREAEKVIQEKIKRTFNSIVGNELDSPEFQKVLVRRSIPALNMKDNSLYGKAQTKKTNISQYDTYSNEKIEFNFHGYNVYNTVRDFLNAVMTRIRTPEGGDIEIPDTLFMTRQTNRNYSRYNADRKMEKKYIGKTPVQGKDSRDYFEDNLDATIRLDFEINGELMDNSYLWNVRLKTVVGKKLETEQRLKGGYLDNKLIQSAGTFQLEPGVEFNQQTTVMDNKDIKNGLIAVLNDLKSQIENINPKEMLKYATVRRNEIA